MTVAFFSNQFASRVRHGVARYARELFHAMRELGSSWKILPVAAWSDLRSEELQRLQAETELRLFPLGRRLTPLAWTFLHRPKIEDWLECEIGLVHAVSLGYSVATLKPLVVTIHDIGPLTHPQYFTNKASWVFMRSLKQAVRDAATLICVSQATANELQEYVLSNYGENIVDRIRVVLEGVASEFFEASDGGGLDPVEGVGHGGPPFILAAGKISPRKNVQGVIRALGELKDRVPHHLVAVGGDGWDFEQVKAQVDNFGIGDRVHLVGYVSDEQLRTLYRKAAVYVHASFFEGFGLTVLEAMAAGCPVVTSNCSSLPEVAGNAARLVDPHNVGEIAEAIANICEDQELATDLRERGRARSKMFTWERCARQVEAIYREVAS